MLALLTFKDRAISSHISSSLLNDCYCERQCLVLTVVWVNEPLISLGGSTMPGGGLLTASGRSGAEESS